MYELPANTFSNMAFRLSSALRAAAAAAAEGGLKPKQSFSATKNAKLAKPEKKAFEKKVRTSPFDLRPETLEQVGLAERQRKNPPVTPQVSFHFLI